MKSRYVYLVLVAALCGDSLAGDWPQWRYDAARSAASPDELPEGLTLQWSRQLPAPLPAWPASQPSLRFDESYSPVAAGKLLYVPSMVTDTVTAYDTDSGEVNWRFFADGPVRLAPAVDAGRLYFGCDDGHLYCLDAAKGTLIWKLRGGPTERKLLGNRRLISTWPVRGGPVVADGVVYFSAGVWPFMGIFVHAVDATTGKSLWTNSGDCITYQTHPHSSPAFGGFVPRGHFAVTDAGLVGPGGRTPPGTYDLETGKLKQFTFTKRGDRSTHGPVPIKAGSRAFEGTEGEVASGNWVAAIRGKPWCMLAADDKLFVSTTEGWIHCFGAGDSDGEPTTYPLPEVAQPPADDATWGSLARATLGAARVDGGYCLLLGVKDGGLAEALARRSMLQVIVIDPNDAKIDAVRKRLHKAGLYGTRVSARVGDPATVALPPYMAELITSESFRSSNIAEDPSLIEAVFAALRPYGGTACLPMTAEQLQPLVDEAKPANAVVKPLGTHWSALTREGALPGAADWTHQYADPGNSVVSQDELAKLPMGMLWFGNGPPNDEVLPRHGHGPSPQVAGGRLVIEGPDMLRATDIYTGRLLWQRDLPGLGTFHDNTLHQPGAGEIGGNYVTLEDSVYVVYGKSILRLDAATGKTLKEITLPPVGGAAAHCGYLGVWKDLLVAGASPVGVSESGFVPNAQYASASKRLVVMDRIGGDVLWTRVAKYSFRHNNIALGADKLFCIDGMSKKKRELLERRGEESPYAPRLVALEARTGDEIWSADDDVFGTFLSYSAKHDVLLQGGSAYRDRATDESEQGMVVYRAASGQVLWKDLDVNYAGPCMLHGDRIITQNSAFSLLTGDPEGRAHPLSGRPMPWVYTRNYGCNTSVASRHMITFRSAAAGFYDLAGDGGTGNFGGFKSSCTSNLIVAGGLLNAPEYTRTCTCNYQNQTSLAMLHDPEVDVWTFNSFDWDGAPVRRVGINLGAPGDRRDAADTLWLDYPPGESPSPNLPLETAPEQPEFYRHHSSRITADGNGELAWVGASGIRDVQSMAITLAGEDAKPRKYTVRLHFAETEPVEKGQRVFDVSLGGHAGGLKGFDVVAAAGGRNRAVIREFTGVEVTDKLTVTLAPAAGSLPAILCGIEIVAEP